MQYQGTYQNDLGHEFRSVPLNVYEHGLNELGNLARVGLSSADLDLLYLPPVFIAVAAPGAAGCAIEQGSRTFRRAICHIDGGQALEIPIPFPGTTGDYFNMIFALESSGFQRIEYRGERIGDWWVKFWTK